MFDTRKKHTFIGDHSNKRTSHAAHIYLYEIPLTLSQLKKMCMRFIFYYYYCSAAWQNIWLHLPEHGMCVHWIHILWFSVCKSVYICSFVLFLNLIFIQVCASRWLTEMRFVFFFSLCGVWFPSQKMAQENCFNVSFSVCVFPGHFNCINCSFVRSFGLSYSILRSCCHRHRHRRRSWTC